MPVSVRISDSELRQRLEDHAYNLPPITDTTRAILIKKLNQLDQQRLSNLPKQGGYSGLDYSSAEEEDCPQPVANSTRRQGGRNGGGDGGKRGQIQEESGAVTSRVTRNSKNNSRSGTPQNGSSGNSKRNVSLMTHSETEEGSEEDEEDEDIEEEEEEEEDDSDEDEEGNGIDKVDLAVQTSFMDSPSPNASRFRGQKLENSKYSSTSQSKGYSTTPAIPIMSPYLRKNINKHGSLNEALATLPTPKTKPPPPTITPNTTSPTTQVTPRILSQSYSRDTTGPCSNMIVSSLIIALAACFFLFLIVQYLSLVPPDAHSGARIPVCAGIRGEQPHTDCVPSSELNQTVELYKVLVKVLPSNKECIEEQNMMTQSQALEKLSVPSALEVWKLRNYMDNLLLLLKQNPTWGISLEERGEEISLGLALSSSLSCSLYKLCVRLVATMWSAAWIIIGVLVVLMVLLVFVKLVKWRQAMIKERKEEVFTLVRQATNFLYQQHQVIAREGKGGPSYIAINHIRDQLISPQDRVAKAGVWADVEEYIQMHESRVRQDVQKIYGEDFRVWQWLSETSWSPGTSPNQGPSSPGTSPNQGQSPTQPSSHSTPIPNTSTNPWPHVPTTHGVVGWQGGAFPLGKHVATPLAPPTSCLKVRHMFDESQKERGWVTGVKQEILRRCAETVILHIAVDTVSEEGTVYIKTAAMEEAGKVFRCLHGQWYRGQLVTAKYLRLERYHDRFPDAKSSCTPMRSSK